MAEGKKIAKLLLLRKKKNAKKPAFRRQESCRYARIGDEWRKPRGRHSKLRKGYKERGKVPSLGYGSPRAVKGLSANGKNPILVSSVKDLSMLDPKKDVAVIKSPVGKKKRMEIAAEAEKLKIEVTNAYRVRLPGK
ncbi:MAG: 50S ribosomal protein L32e [Candidatus Aenigmatarchaeota archaeon]